jgi:hypothetical protein
MSAHRACFKRLGRIDNREWALAANGLLFSRPASGRRRRWHVDGSYGETYPTAQAAREWAERR